MPQPNEIQAETSFNVPPGQEETAISDKATQTETREAIHPRESYNIQSASGEQSETAEARSSDNPGNEESEIKELASKLLGVLNRRRRNQKLPPLSDDKNPLFSQFHPECFENPSPQVWKDIQEQIYYEHQHLWHKGVTSRRGARGSHLTSSKVKSQVANAMPGPLTRQDLERLRGQKKTWPDPPYMRGN